MELQESTFMAAWGKFIPTFKDIVMLTMLPCAGRPTLWVWSYKRRLEWSWGTWSLSYMLQKVWQCTYPTWLDSLMKRIAPRLATWWRPSYILAISIHATQWPRGWARPICLPPSHRNCEGGGGPTDHPTLPSVPVCTDGRVRGQCYEILLGGLR